MRSMVFANRRSGAKLTLLLSAVALLAIGCFDKESKPTNPSPGDPTYREATSIDNVLYNLKKSYVDMNINAYQAIPSDSFTFVFAPQDIGGPDNNPPTWGRADELLSAAHLFSKTTPNKDGYIAVSTSLSFQVGPEIPNDIRNWTKVVLSQIFLTVTSRQKDTSDPLDYLVQGDQANLWFAKEGADWKIIMWEDKPIGALATKSTTWGQIKGSFR